MLAELRRIVQEVGRVPAFNEALDLIVREICQTLGTEVCSVYLKTPDRRQYLFAANEGLNSEMVGKARIDRHKGLVGLVDERAEPINLQEARLHPRYWHVPELGEYPFNAFLGVPIIHQREVLGVLVAQQRRKRRFRSDEEAFLVTLATQLASIIAHADAVGDLHQLVSADHPRQDLRIVGVAGSPGVGMGVAVPMQPLTSLDNVPDREAEDPEVELAAFDRAVDRVRGDLGQIGEQFAGSLPPEELALFDVYLHMLDDDALTGEVRQRIRRGQWAQGALCQVIREHMRGFERMTDAYLRERATDVEDLGLRVLAYLQDIRARKHEFPPETILVADEITPSMITTVPAEQLKGLVSRRGSVTSHVAIMAHALDIPAVMGAVDLPIYDLDGQPVIVDGHYGEVYANPSAHLTEQYREVMQAEEAFDSQLDELHGLPCVTLDGWRTLLWVNIGLTSDISRSLERGAEGIGLFRTEVPFMTEDRFPTEDEQRSLYREHMAAFEPRPVTMRTLDIGGDKALSYFPISEENPFLGWRGIRVTLDHPEIFVVQARAMLKANAGLKGVLRIMLPMVSNLSEVEEATKLVRQAYAEVLEEGYNVKPPRIGVMVEVPAAVYQARELARCVDFLAVGSNDLTQYMLAVDRNNARVAGLYRDFHPAVLRALREVARHAHAERKGVGICGELAGTPSGAVLLMAMGYQVLSMNATNLPRVKWALRNMRRSDARRMLARVLKMSAAEDIRHYMEEQLIEAGLARLMPRPRGRAEASSTPDEAA